MEKEIIKLKSGEKLAIEIEGKIIEIEQEEKAPEHTDHTSKALGVFMQKVADTLPELKGEQGDKGDKGDK